MSRLLMLKLLPLLAFALLSAGCNRSGNTAGLQLPTTKLDPSSLVATISQGDAIDLEEHLAPDTWTVLEFGAEW